MLQSAEASAFEGCVQFLARRFELIGCQVRGNGDALCPTDYDAGEWFGNEEAIPGTHHPCALRLQMEDADGRGGELGELDGAHLGLVDGAAGAVGGEDGGAATLDYALEPEQ